LRFHKAERQIVNAIQSMSGVEDGNRELHISTVSIEPHGVCVAVRDTGHGLRPESLSRLFEPFYTTKPEGMGMGMGLTIALRGPDPSDRRNSHRIDRAVEKPRALDQ
jgi:phosphoglycerate-specific signal transduction histidine kinase